MTRDGKLETVINGRGPGVPPITVISHEEPPYDSVPLLGRPSATLRPQTSVPPPLPPHYHPSATSTQTPHPYQYTVRGLPRQGSSSLESTTATAPIHTHTIECVQR